VEVTVMNAFAEPIELLEAECNAHGWHDELASPEVEEFVFDEACSERVLDWMVRRICSIPLPEHA
jgi:hypothetical protein